MARLSTLRISRPVYLDGATRFSDDRDELSPVEIVRRLRSQPWATDQLLQATTVSRQLGRKREAGKWMWAYVAFAASQAVDVEPWWRDSKDTSIWQEAGFAQRTDEKTGELTHRPSYQNVQRRFAELECFSDDVRAAAGRFIQRAIAHDPRVVEHIHVDCTEAETHAALVHDCPPTAKCMQHRRGRRGVVARRPQRTSTDEQRAIRHKLAELPTDEELAQRHQDGSWDGLEELDDGRVRVRSGAHWYRTLDPTAGARAYTRDGKLIKFWFGYYVQQAVSHLYGAPLAVAMDSAARAEKDIYLHKTFGQLVQNTGGCLPQTATFDRGFAWDDVYEHNTRHRIASVMPFRKRHAGDREHDHETHDRHGVTRCRHCGGPTQLIRDAAQPYPRLWVRCHTGVLGIPRTEGCAKDQTIACSTDWRTLTRLPRDDERFQELAATHSMYERIHRLWRSRWKVGGNDVETRPKRMGIACQNLRAQTALMIEWMLICWREGFLGRAQRRQRKLCTLADKTAERLAAIRKERQQAGLDPPYGPAAVRLTIKGASLKPPSRRAADTDDRAARRKLKRAERRGKPKSPPR